MYCWRSRVYVVWDSWLDSNVSNKRGVAGSRLVEFQVDAEEKEEENRRSHKFKARPLHIADEDWQTIQNRQTVRRRQRNQMRKQMVSDILTAWNATATARDGFLVPLSQPELARH